jgi:hypothetical protein
MRISARDRLVIERARAKLAGARVDFALAVRALREAVEETIDDGRVFLLGSAGGEPILGSLISGVGIVDGARGVELVRVAGAPIALERFA